MSDLIEFEFEYIVDSSENVRSIRIRIPDNGEPYVDLSDDAYGKALDKVSAKNPGSDVEMWSV